MTVPVRIAILLSLAVFGPAAGRIVSAQQPLVLDLLGDAAQLRARQTIETALAAKVDVAFDETSLEDVARWLRSRGIPTQLDQRALDDFGIGTDTPVTFDQRGVSLRSALQMILRPLEMTWIIRDEVLLMTTPEEAETCLRTVAYQVGDLLELETTQVKFATMHGLDAAIRTGYDFDKLTELISSTVDPDSWDEVGGPGAIEGVALRDVPLLVISQTDDVHERIARMLANLRLATSRPGASRKLGRPTGSRRSGLPSTQFGSPRQTATVTTDAAARHVVAAPNWFAPVDHD